MAFQKSKPNLAKPQYKAESTPEPTQQHSPIEIANIMAGAAVKKLQMHKSYKNGSQTDPMDLKKSAVNADTGKDGDQDGDVEDGTVSPSLKAQGGHVDSGFDSSTKGDEDVVGGAEHPSMGKPNRSKSQIAAIKHKIKGK